MLGVERCQILSPKLAVLVDELFKGEQAAQIVNIVASVALLSGGSMVVSHSGRFEKNPR